MNRIKIQKLHESGMFWFLVFTYLVYPSCSQVVLDTFNCDHMGSESYLFADYSTKCYTHAHTVMKIYASIFVFIYPLGCPLMYYILLWNHRDEIDPTLPSGKKARMNVNDDSDVKLAINIRHNYSALVPYSFLFESYEPQFWWWEVLVCVKRLLLTCANLYVANHTELQPYVVLFFSLVFLKLYIETKPYVLDLDDVLVEISLWSLIAILIFSILLQFYEEASDLKSPAGLEEMMTCALVAVFVPMGYFCMSTLWIEIESFENVLSMYFPLTIGWVKRRRAQLSRIGAYILGNSSDDQATHVEVHSTSLGTEPSNEPEEYIPNNEMSGFPVLEL